MALAVTRLICGSVKTSTGRPCDRPKGHSGLHGQKDSKSKCEHGKRRSRCKECGGSQICEHGTQHDHCKDCGGSQICEHGAQRSTCKRCGGGAICEHNRQRAHCKKCGGTSYCEHGRHRSQCKQCGTYRKLLKGGFSHEEIKEIGAVACCQFPGCQVRAGGVVLHSDHHHDGSNKIMTENYRGEVCPGCNRRLAILDEHPEFANVLELLYIVRRPYTRHEVSDASVV
jgi:hypothetical protein